MRSTAFAIISIVCFMCSANAQTAQKYEFYRYPQFQAISVDPVGALLGRANGAYEWRLDPNFSRRIEFVFQRNVQDKKVIGSEPESAYSFGLTERLYLYDNAAIQVQFVGVGLGVALVRQTIAIRLTTELGYKFVFGGSTGHFFIEPMLLLDAYLVTNHDGKRILPYFELPLGYIW